jgi:hypothetical protein
MIKREEIKNMNYEVRELVVLEALLRRISLVNMPFVLKGSLLTRQYLDNPDIRYVDDIDFLYLGKIKDVEHARETFTNWMIQVTEMDLDDGIKFRSFRENAFWRYIDYAMADDFPTINTDLEYYFTDEPGEYRELYLDVSFNLEMEVEPVPLEYRPVFGDSFIVPYSVPLSIQVAWKLHQTIVRPRFKDLYDLKYLLSHPSYDHQALKETLQTLVNECSMDPSITKEDIKKILVDDLTGLYHSLSNDYFLVKYADSNNHEEYFMRFVTDLRKIMDRVGLNESAYNHLPSLHTKNCNRDQ